MSFLKRLVGGRQPAPMSSVSSGESEPGDFERMSLTLLEWETDQDASDKRIEEFKKEYGFDS